MVKAIADKENEPRSEFRPWKTFALFSGATLQLATCIVVFGYLGHLAALRMHHSWITAAGVAVGVVVGSSGLAFLAKQVLGDKP
ncbi:MAG: hypothetical protein K6T30_06315 [Alicyclobacillus sp.]|nr:hypothetical protein [Alicyclobacillus sp.]